MAGYHFGDEDYVTLNGSIGIGLGLSGGLIMDRTGNVYFVRGGGIVSSLGGTVATGKLNKTYGINMRKGEFVFSVSARENRDSINIHLIKRDWIYHMGL